MLDLDDCSMVLILLFLPFLSCSEKFPEQIGNCCSWLEVEKFYACKFFGVCYH